ncbi:Crp/Fnr family transcriptional regulator [Danxiaibacter flavus]|uniref:Crp/Fnr family transcriptional regulator n=1 Tax=Danxiaibacter flavus TaxID=3049108 RepID=A0ABV3ZAP2_9BACT|nr:Crp/Fnr family transcriptional regulator [Chitinophagaceae bacterium DXS]
MIDSDLLLSWGATYKKVPAGEFLFKEGASCNFYCQVESGKFKLINIEDNGKEYLQDIVEPSDCIGELSLFNGSLYEVSAIALVDSIVIRLCKDSFERLLRDYPNLHKGFTDKLAEKLRFKSQFLKEFSCHEPEHRIRVLLKYLIATNKNYCKHCSQVKMTRQQIADMTGLRVETVIRVMRTMHEKGQLLINGGKVYYNDMSGIITKCCVAS